MIDINFKSLKSDGSFQKNILYKITENTTVSVAENHEKSREVVYLKYSFGSEQYGIFGNEYRSPSVLKHGCKTTDVLACVVDEKKKEIVSFILDIKSNISAFSDNLLKDNAVLVAVKEIRDFTEQLHDENLHKNSFLIFYKDVDYQETTKVGIATKNFEKEKFLAVADFLENLKNLNNATEVSDLMAYKLKRNLMPYVSEIERIRNFANQTVKISGKTYPLQVYLLQKISESEYEIWIDISAKEFMNVK